MNRDQRLKSLPEGMRDDALALEAFINSQSFQFFRGYELFTGLEKGNELPPRSLWGNIIPTLDRADALRHAVGIPMRITSAYRSEEYNRQVGGHPESKHPEFFALDLTFDPKAMNRALRALALIQKVYSLSVAGLGIYPWGLHLDTGESLRRWVEFS